MRSVINLWLQLRRVIYRPASRPGHPVAGKSKLIVRASRHTRIPAWIHRYSEDIRFSFAPVFVVERWSYSKIAKTALSRKRPTGDAECLYKSFAQINLRMRRRAQWESGAERAFKRELLFTADALRQKGRLKWISCFLSRYYLPSPRHVQFRERPERLFWTQSCHGQTDSALCRRNNTPCLSRTRHSLKRPRLTALTFREINRYHLHS